MNNKTIANELIKIAKRLTIRRVKATKAKTIKSDDPYNWKEIVPVFEKEAPQLVKKLNDALEKFGLESFFQLRNQRYFSDGHKQGLKFNAVGDNKGVAWWKWTIRLNGTQTKSLIYKHDGSEICLKKTLRPTSHRGLVWQQKL